VVLALIGLMMAALPAVLSAGLPGLRLKSEARHLADELRNAHRSALRAHKEGVVTVDTAARSYAIGSSGSASVLPSGIALQFRNIPYGEANGQAARLRFFPDGSSTGGSIGLVQRGQQYWISVDWLTGRVSLSD
jgi:general secretion pathway protein H